MSIERFCLLLCNVVEYIFRGTAESFCHLSMDSNLKDTHYLSSEKFSEFPLHIILMGSEQ